MTKKELMDTAILEVLSDPALSGQPIDAHRLRELAIVRLTPRMLGEDRPADLTAWQFMAEGKILAKAGAIAMTQEADGRLLFSALVKPLPAIQAKSLDLVPGALEELRAMKKLLDEHGAPMTAMAIIDLCEQWIASTVLHPDRRSALSWLRVRIMMAALRGITVSLPGQSGASS